MNPYEPPKVRCMPPTKNSDLTDHSKYFGMSLRDWFAASLGALLWQWVYALFIPIALTAALLLVLHKVKLSRRQATRPAWPIGGTTPSASQTPVAIEAYRIADAMLAERTTSDD